MARGRQVTRLIKLMLTLGGRPGRTVAELAARLGCVERTVWRDLQILEELDQGISARNPGFKEHARFRETIEILRQAIERRRTVEITYHSFGRDALSTRRVNPYHLLTGELEVTLHVAPELDVKRWILSYGKIERFPEDFMFHLSEEEAARLRSQIVTLQTGRLQHRKYLPYAFTEQGVAMLSSVLRSPARCR